MSQHIDAVAKQSSIVNNLTTNDSSKALSAAQGKALNDKYTSLNSNIAPFFTGTFLGNNPNFDNVTNPGVYYFGETTNATNPPTTSNGYMLMLVITCNTYICQIVFGGRESASSGSRIWVRYKYQSQGWQSWKYAQMQTA